MNNKLWWEMWGKVLCFKLIYLDQTNANCHSLFSHRSLWVFFLQFLLEIIESEPLVVLSICGTNCFWGDATTQWHLKIFTIIFFSTKQNEEGGKAKKFLFHQTKIKEVKRQYCLLYQPKIETRKNLKVSVPLGKKKWKSKKLLHQAKKKREKIQKCQSAKQKWKCANQKCLLYLENKLASRIRSVWKSLACVTFGSKKFCRVKQNWGSKKFLGSKKFFE